MIRRFFPLMLIVGLLFGWIAGGLPGVLTGAVGALVLNVSLGLILDPTPMPLAFVNAQKVGGTIQVVLELLGGFLGGWSFGSLGLFAGHIAGLFVTRALLVRAGKSTSS